MIYIKIYTDKDENGEDILVFDSAKNDNKHDFFTVAGEKRIKRLFKDEYYSRFDDMTEIIGVEGVVISPEARALFLELINDNSLCHKEQYCYDFEFRGCSQGQYGWDSGSFAFCPNDIENGNTKRILRRGDKFAINYGNAKGALEYMSVCDNEMIKNLDISESVDKNTIYEAYYTEARARGEELGCDVDTIRKTPIQYLTEEQKNVIREDYRRRVNAYDSQEWHDNGDFLDDKIRSELLEKYLKIVDFRKN